LFNANYIKLDANPPVINITTMQKVFQSKFPILEACMNRGSTVELGVAVHNAGGYPSLCSWTYNGRLVSMQHDLDNFVKQTNSNRIHLSFEINELAGNEAVGIVKSYNIATVEVIFGYTDTTRSYNESELESEDEIVASLKKLHELGVTVLKRSYSTMDEATRQRYFIDGFCVKGTEAAGFTSTIPTRDLFIQQRDLTPTALMIPYGGVGTPEQVKDYFDLGAEIVAVGTLLAMSAESPVKTETKLAAINATKADLGTRQHQFQQGAVVVERKQNMLTLGKYTGPDDANGTIGLVKGLYKKNDHLGHAYLGHSVDQVKSILPCSEIIKNLTSLL